MRLRVLSDDPAPTPREREFLRDVAALEPVLNDARRELRDALAVNDVDGTLAASRRVLSIGMLLRDHAYRWHKIDIATDEPR